MADSYLQYLSRRVALSIGEVFLSITLLFGLTTLMAWRKLHSRVAYARYCLTHFCPSSVPPPEKMRAQVMEAHDLYTPFLDRYVNHLINVVTLDWGSSTSFQAPVYHVLDGRIQTTLEYVVPGLVVAILVGIGLGMLAALTKNSRWDWTTRVIAYTLFGIPAFVVAAYLSTGGDSFLVRLARGMSASQIAALAIALSLLGNQLRLSRAAALEETGEKFVRLLQAKGASRIRVGRHILRNAATTIASATLGELLTIVMLNIYVLEYVLDIDGIALASLRAVQNGDVSLAISSTLVLILFGISGNLLQDLLYGYLDPRTYTS